MTRQEQQRKAAGDASRPAPVNVQRQMGEVAAHMRAIDKSFVRLLESHDVLAEEVETGRREVASLRARLAKLQSDNHDLKVQLDRVIAEKLRDSSNVSTTENLRYQALAGRFDTFVKQDLLALVQPLIGNDEPPAQRPYKTALLIARTLAAVLKDGVVDGVELLRRLDAQQAGHLLPQANQICIVADEIQDETIALDNADGEGWQLNCRRGEAIDPTLQVPWGPCEANAPIDFVVIPGYRVNGRTYLHQAVFTRIGPAD